MKKNVIALLALFTSVFAFAQEVETKTESELGIKIVGKIGFGTLETSNAVNLHGNVNAGDLLFYYSLPNGNSFSAGVGTLQFTANGASAGETYSLDQTYLRIPAYYNYSLSILKDQLDDKLQAYGGIGLYAQTLLKEEVKTTAATTKNKNQGWNAGLGFQLGLKFDVTHNLDFGLGIETQSDLTDMKKDKVERKLDKLSTVNFQLNFKF